MGHFQLTHSSLLANSVSKFAATSFLVYTYMQSYNLFVVDDINFNFNITRHKQDFINLG